MRPQTASGPATSASVDEPTLDERIRISDVVYTVFVATRIPHVEHSAVVDRVGFSTGTSMRV